MERVTYEDALLTHYKKYLQKLEKMTSNLAKGSRQKLTPEFVRLGEVGVQCLCELLLAHSYFNFGQNIAQLLVYLINSNVASVRTCISDCFQELFRTEQKFDLTLFVS